ncbi:MarR family winged helix-turn-helix transcriptional regulator [Chromobacterium sp. Beijing]|uniref:MarR family winged helix-turn-helix transcriptional regulator n=1 Tax=Chromobacterium sp. Beijing TaxID=2735795 RepID=UPI001F2FB7FF|nr:MarR family transcriptional regulator [Chromobacterium sp. Beijing]UJB30616.1 MarR family transcriptional regulator [Chromobacterium sp. Beijing]
MSHFEETRKRLLRVKTRIPEFPLALLTLTRLNYHVQKRLQDLTNAALRKHGLTESSYLVLAVLYGSEQETTTPGSLAETCSQKPANMTRICNDLEKQGLIHRGGLSDDRRAVAVTLSDAGRERIRKLLPDVWGNLGNTFAGFSAEEMQQQEQFYLRQLSNLNQAAPNDEHD